MMIEVVAFACRGTLVDWAGAIEAVAYELARRNGESPLDRGAALRRRVEALADGHGLARGFERLARERRYRVGTRRRRAARERGRDGAAAAGGARGRGARARVRAARVLAVSRGESPRALDLFGDAFEDVVARSRARSTPIRTRSCT